MATKAASTRQPAARPKPGGQRWFVWLGGLICGALITMAGPAMLLLGILLLPALLLLAVEIATGRPLARASLLLGLASAVRPVLLFTAMAGAGYLSVLPVASAGQIALSWSLQGLGWLACELFPLIGQTWVHINNARRLAELARLEDRWRASWDIETIRQAATKAE